MGSLLRPTLGKHLFSVSFLMAVGKMTFCRGPDKKLTAKNQAQDILMVSGSDVCRERSKALYINTCVFACLAERDEAQAQDFYISAVVY
jgi:hypothetical protein